MTHSTSDVWAKLDSQGQQIVALGANQVATDSRLEGLEKSVQRGFDNVNTALTAMSEKLIPDTPWIGIGMLILGVMAMFGTYSYLLISPLNVIQQSTKTQIEHLEQRVETMQENEIAIARELGVLQANSDRNSELIAAVDRFGSRRWNKESSEEE
jgi:hypothetical protein